MSDTTYCPVCGKVKSKTAEVLGKQIVTGIMCDCDIEERKQIEERLHRQSIDRERRRAREVGILDGKLREATFANAQPNKYIEPCRQYAEQWEKMKSDNVGLLMYGKVGAGKTYLAACIANELIDNGHSVFMTSFPQILSDEYTDKELMEKIRSADLVIIDDLGAERNSGYGNEKTYYVIDERYKTNKPIIITTNMTWNEISKPREVKDARTFDRIMEMCVAFEFSEESRRPSMRTGKLQTAKSLF